MKKTTLLKTTCAALATTLLAALTTRAGIDINDNVTLAGYAAGSLTYHKTKTNSESTADLDAAQLAALLKFDPITAKLSIYTPAGAHQLYLLDACATYNLPQGFSITAGRYLSYIGFTPFDAPDKAFITSSVPNAAPFTGTPGYHEGARLDYQQGNWTAGLSVVDSLYSPPDQPYRGDASAGNGLGIEAKARYTTDKWTANLSLGYENQKQSPERDDNGLPIHNPGSPQIYIADLWAKWKPAENTTLGAEAFYRRDHVNKDSNYPNLKQNTWFILAQFKQQVDETYGFGARISAGGQALGNYWKITVLPLSYTASKNLELRLEFSYTKFSNRVTTISNDGFAGLQAILKF